MAKNYAILEPLRNAITKSETRSCMGKLFDLDLQIERQYHRNNTRINEVALPSLWIFSSTASVELPGSFNTTVDEENWSKERYLFLGRGIKNHHYCYSSTSQHAGNAVS